MQRLLYIGSLLGDQCCVIWFPSHHGGLPPSSGQDWEGWLGQQQVQGLHLHDPSTECQNCLADQGTYLSCLIEHSLWDFLVCRIQQRRERPSWITRQTNACSHCRELTDTHIHFSYTFSISVISHEVMWSVKGAIVGGTWTICLLPQLPIGIKMVGITLVPWKFSTTWVRVWEWN